MSEATTLTLTDFLLARIAEDEAKARARAFAEDCIPKSGPPNPRPLAECEAKRRLLSDPILMDGQRINGDPGMVMEQIMLHLAAVYADHPDYRDEWKP